MDSTHITDSMEKKVEKGAEFLDDIRPGWEDEIDIESLDMGYCRICILGQLYGTFGKGVINAMPGKDGKPEEAVHYGFDILNSYEENYSDLGFYWIQEIKQRQN